MPMNETAEDIRWSMLLLIFFVATTVTGCQSKLFSVEGTIATQQQNVALKSGGPNSGRWQSADVIVEYSYVNDANSFQIEGSAELAARLTKSFTMVKHFSLQANFLDEDKKILQSVVIVTVGPVPIEPWRFSQSTTLPNKVKAMNFSYTGSVREHGAPDGGIDSSFWQVP
jgi:hypothetical protein